MVKRKNEIIWNEGEEDNSPSNIASLSQMASRRKVVARGVIPTPEKGSKMNSSGGGMEMATAKNSSPGSITAAGFRLRKTKRLELYYSSMLELNQKFAAWAEREEHKIWAKLESGELDKTSMPLFYIPDVELYINKTEEIKRKYMPATGDVLTFGSGDFGQLGHTFKEDGNNDSNTPRCVMTLRNSGITAVACGGLFSLGVSDNGQVVSWGCNDEGSLGIVNVDTVYIPQGVKGFIPSQYEVATNLEPVSTWKDVTGDDITDPSIPLSSKYDEKITAVAAGDCHSLCLSSSGRVYFFGSYKDRDGKSWKDAAPKDDPRIHPEPKTHLRKEVSPIGAQHWPIHVWQMEGEVVQIDCGSSFNVAVVEKEVDGQSMKSCVTWGIGECGELARPVHMPIKPKDGNVIGPKHEKRPDYEVDEIRDNYLIPKPVVWDDSLNKRTVESVGCGGWHLLVISRNLGSGTSAVHSSGLNNFGQLGLGDSGDEPFWRYKLTEVRPIRFMIMEYFLSFLTMFHYLIISVYRPSTSCRNMYMYICICIYTHA